MIETHRVHILEFFSIIDKLKYQSATYHHVGSLAEFPLPYPP